MYECTSITEPVFFILGTERASRMWCTSAHILYTILILDTNRKAIVLSNDADTIDDNRFLQHVDKEDNTRRQIV